MRYETLVARFWLRLRRVPQSPCRRQSRDKRQELWGRECKLWLNENEAEISTRAFPLESPSNKRKLKARRNRSFLSWLLPVCQNESLCETIHMKMYFSYRFILM